MAQIRTSAELIEMLQIVDENIIGEALEQPRKFVDAARYRVARMRIRSQAEAQADVLAAEVAIVIRGREKVSEAALKEKVTVNKKVIAARANAEKMKAAEKFADLLIDAFKQRRDAIRITAEAQIYEGMKDTRELDRLEERQNLRKAARRLEERRREQKLE